MDQLEQCVNYFKTGGPTQWISGGVFILALIVPVFTKWNITDMVRKLSQKK